MQNRDDFRDLNIKVNLTLFNLAPRCSRVSPAFLSSSNRTVAQIIRSKGMENIPAPSSLKFAKTRSMENIFNHQSLDKIIAMNFITIIKLTRMYPKLQIIPILWRGRLCFRNNREKNQESVISRCLKMPAFIQHKDPHKANQEDIAWINRYSSLQKASKCDMDLILISNQIANNISIKRRKVTAVGHRNNSSLSCHNPQTLPNRSVGKAKHR